MRTDTQVVLNNLAALKSFDIRGDLTHDEVRAILTLVRRIKTNLEVIDAQKENDI
jgi:hypothetical protein